jgi:heat shock protein HslJ
MKKIVLIAVLLTIIFASCKSDKSTTNSSAAKAPDAVKPETFNSSDYEADLEGTWELVSVIGSNTPFATLYPSTKPTLTLDSRPKQISGTTSCNTYTGSYVINDRSISFANGWASTKMACEGEGEGVFIERLKKADKFFIKEQNTLMLLLGDVALLEFKKIAGARSY